MGADSVHPGYGFLAENAAFAAAVIAQGLTLSAPSRVGLSKWVIRSMAESCWAMPVCRCSLAVVWWKTRLRPSSSSAKSALPVVVKPSGGGGGIGMHVVRQQSELAGALSAAAETAQRAFSSEGVFIERWIDRPRHIEFQILADQRGAAMHLYERDCSVQRRHQKLIEESPAPGLERDLMLQQAQTVSDICQQLGYDNLGTVETPYTPEGDMGFLEMNTRIQVEHGVTEEVTGIDLVATQIELAAGMRIAKAI